MRFAWLQKNSDLEPGEESSISRLIMIVYNIIWWAPLIFVLLGQIDYGTGFVGFTVITVVRFIANLYRNNVLEPAQAIIFPFRSP